MPACLKELSAATKPMTISTKNIAADEIIWPWDSAAVSASPSDCKE